MPSLSNASSLFGRNGEVTPHFLWSCEELQIAETVLKTPDKVGRVRLPNSMTHHTESIDWKGETGRKARPAP